MTSLTHFGRIKACSFLERMLKFLRFPIFDLTHKEMSPGTATGGLFFLLICLQEAFKHLKLIAACMNTLTAGQIANTGNDWK